MLCNTAVAVQGRRRSHSLQRGFGLVELMISITIGLVILAALVALFVGSSRNNREMATASSVIENGRFAIQLLEGDIIHAGFWGTYVPPFDDQTEVGEPDPLSIPSDVPDPCLPYDEWDDSYRVNLIGIPVQKYDAASLAADTSCGDVVSDPIKNTDILVVRHLETCAVGAPNCPAPMDGELYFQSSLCDKEVPEFLMGLWNIADFSLRKRSCDPGVPVPDLARADRRRFVSSIYYVQDREVDAGLRVPTLVRSQFELKDGSLKYQKAEPLIEGIEAFRVRLGVDRFSETGGEVNYFERIDWVEPKDLRLAATNRGDGMPDGDFVSCAPACAVEELSNVTAVQLYVLARSRERTRGYQDEKEYTLGDEVIPVTEDAKDFKRHVYSATVRLPNISGRRIRPGAMP